MAASNTTEFSLADSNGDQNESSMFSDMKIDAATLSETHPSWSVKGDCRHHFGTNKVGSTKYSVTNKKRAQKKLYLSSDDYKNLLLGKKLQFFHPNSGASLLVRPIFSKNSTSTGTPHESSSCEAAVPIPSPLTVIGTSMDNLQAELKNLTDEEDQTPEVKRPCLSTERILDPIIEIKEVSKGNITVLKQSGKGSPNQLSRQSPFIFSAMKTHASKRWSRFMGHDRSTVKKTKLTKDGSSAISSRTTTLVRVVSCKRKEVCPIEFEAFYSPRKRRRLCFLTTSVCIT